MEEGEKILFLRFFFSPRFAARRLSLSSSPLSIWEWRSMSKSGRVKGRVFFSRAPQQQRKPQTNKKINWKARRGKKGRKGLGGCRRRRKAIMLRKGGEGKKGKLKREEEEEEGGLQKCSLIYERRQQPLSRRLFLPSSAVKRWGL